VHKTNEQGRIYAKEEGQIDFKEKWSNVISSYRGVSVVCYYDTECLGWAQRWPVFMQNQPVAVLDRVTNHSHSQPHDLATKRTMQLR
jgi:hypothetical protein